MIGLRWKDIYHPWSKDGKEFSNKQLAKHLCLIINKEKKRKLKFPTEPKPIAPTRNNEGVLGTQIDFVAELDRKYKGDKATLRQKAAEIRKKTRELRRGKYLLMTATILSSPIAGFT